MAHTITLKSARFDPAAEAPNPINPIAGQALLLWLRARLVGAGWTVSEPAAEDWGWYMDVSRDGATYLVGASGEAEPPDGAAAPSGREIEWVLQVERHRTLGDKLLGRNRLGANEPLTAALQQWLRAEPDMRDVEVDWSA